jgi:dienelactone hydrolase
MTSADDSTNLPQQAVPPSPPVVADPALGGARVARNGVFADLYRSSLPSPRPAILLLGGSEGGLNPGVQWEARSLAAEGFHVLYLGYFGCPGTPSHLVGVPLETFDRGLSLLRAEPAVDPTRLAIVGASKGAEAALLVAARHPDVRAVVVGMPSSVAWPGINPGAATMEAIWTLSGVAVPFLPYAVDSYAESGIFGMYNDALPNKEQHPDAIIPAERIAAPMLLVCGAADTLWPACAMAGQIADRLRACGRPAPMSLPYENAGHGVFGPPVEPPYHPLLAAYGGTPEANAVARSDSWPKAIAFLKSALGPD